MALRTARDLKSSSNIFDLQSRGLNNHPDIEEAEATYVAERPKGTKAGGPFWLLRHITGIATKRNDPAGILGPNVILDSSRFGGQTPTLPGLFQSTTCAFGLRRAAARTR